MNLFQTTLPKILFLALLFFYACKTSVDKPVPEDSKVEIPAESVTVQPVKTTFEDGDLIFHTSLSNQSMAIQIASKSKYSHVGMIYQEGDQFFVYEAVQPVKLTPLNDWIKRGKNGAYVVKRLKNRDELLTPAGIAKMKTIGKKYSGKDYDLQFMWSDDKIYCSELVWKIYKEAFNIEIGKPEQIKDFDLSDPAVQVKIKERYGDHVPMEELVITPDRMFRSELLETVMEQK